MFVKDFYFEVICVLSLHNINKRALHDDRDKWISILRTISMCTTWNWNSLTHWNSVKRADSWTMRCSLILCACFSLNSQPQAEVCDKEKSNKNRFRPSLCRWDQRSYTIRTLDETVKLTNSQTLLVVSEYHFWMSKSYVN